MTVNVTTPPLALVALRRARLRAIEVAHVTNTCLVVYRDGKIVLIPPTELPGAVAAEDGGGGTMRARHFAAVPGTPP